jgi:hypothetical protein
MKAAPSLSTQSGAQQTGALIAKKALCPNPGTENVINIRKKTATCNNKEERTRKQCNNTHELAVN